MKLDGGANFSRDGGRRTALWRKWDHGPRALFVGLNPSTAGRLGCEDHSTRKIRGFCERLGFGGYLLENLFDRISTDPRELSRKVDGQAPDLAWLCSADNLSRVQAASRQYQVVVCCWGRHGKLHAQDKDFLRMMRGTPMWRKLRAFRINADGSPAHPLMLPYTTALVTYNPEVDCDG